MFCTNCGRPLRPIDKFCGHCGTPAMTTDPAYDAPVEAPKEPESRSLPNSIRTSQSTTGNTPQPALSGTSSFHSVPSGREEQESLDGSAAAPPSVSSVFSYRARPNAYAAPQPGPEPVPAADQPINANLPFAPSAREAVPQNARGDMPPAAAPVSREVLPVTNEVQPPPYAPPASPGIDSAFTSVAPAEREIPPTAYDTEVADEHDGGRALWIAIAVVLIAGLAAIFWMLRPGSSKPAAATAPGGEVSMTITPALTHTAPLNGVDLAATVAGGGDPDVNWTVQESGASGHVVPRGVLSKGNQLSATAVYVAPSVPGVYHVIATSKADPSKSAVAEITVTGEANATQ